MSSLAAERGLQVRGLQHASLVAPGHAVPRPGMEPMSPALVGSFPSTAPPGSPLPMLCLKSHCRSFCCCSGLGACGGHLPSCLPLSPMPASLSVGPRFWLLQRIILRTFSSTCLDTHIHMLTCLLKYNMLYSFLEDSPKQLSKNSHKNKGSYF